MKDTVFFFPFTKLAESSQIILSLLFSRVAFLDISEESSEGGANQLNYPDVFVPVRPAKKDLDASEAAFSEYLDWIKIHQGNERNLKLLIQSSPHFKEDSQITSIKSQLMGSKNTKIENDSPPNNYEKSLLFLKAAHRCDWQNESIDNDLHRIGLSQQNMLKTLRGDDVDNFDENILSPSLQMDAGAAMTRERVFAWLDCMSEAAETKGDDKLILVTTSPAVSEFVASISKDQLNALDIDEIKVHENDCENKPAWQQAFLKQIKSAFDEGKFMLEALPQVNDNCAVSAKIKLSVISSNEIKRYFNLSGNQVAVCLVEQK